MRVSWSGFARRGRNGYCNGRCNLGCGAIVAFGYRRGTRGVLLRVSVSTITATAAPAIAPAAAAAFTRLALLTGSRRGLAYRRVERAIRNCRRLGLIALGPGLTWRPWLALLLAALITTRFPRLFTPLAARFTRLARRPRLPALLAFALLAGLPLFAALAVLLLGIARSVAPRLLTTTARLLRLPFARTLAPLAVAGFPAIASLTTLGTAVAIITRVTAITAVAILAAPASPTRIALIPVFAIVATALR